MSNQPTSQGQAYAVSAQQLPTSSASGEAEQQLTSTSRGRTQPHQPAQGTSSLPKFHGPPPFTVSSLAAHPTIKPELAGGPFLNAPAFRAPHLFPQPQAGSFASPTSRKGGERTRGGGHKKQCNCKNSRCLKLYCECFASGRYCESCNCVNCFNNRENESVRQSAVDTILERNPNAFRPKIQAPARRRQNNDVEAQTSRGVSSDAAPPPRHLKGCNCKKSTCLKKYCECFQAAIYCSDNCKCIDCKNFEGSEARQLVLAAQESAVSAMVLSPAKRKAPTHSLASLLPSLLPAAAAIHPLPQVVNVRGGPLGHSISRLRSVPQPAAMPAPPPHSRPIHEMVNMLVKGDTISEVCRLLQMVADDEAAKVNATAADEARALAPDAAAAAATAAAEAVAEVAAEGPEAGAAPELEAACRDAAALQDDCSAQLSARRVETKERVVMVEFLSVLQSFNAAGQRRSSQASAAPAEGPPHPALPSASQPGASAEPPGTSSRTTPPVQLVIPPQPSPLSLPPQGAVNGTPAFHHTSSAAPPIVSAAASFPLASSVPILQPRAMSLPSSPHPLAAVLSLARPPAPPTLPTITLPAIAPHPTVLPAIELPLRQLNMPAPSPRSAAPPRGSAAGSVPPPPPQVHPQPHPLPQGPPPDPMELDHHRQPLQKVKPEPRDPEQDQQRQRLRGAAGLYPQAVPMDADSPQPRAT